MGAQCEKDGAVLIPKGRLTDLEKAPLLGTVLADNYAIFDIVGRGGMGIVDKGIHKRLNRVVAVKTMRMRVEDTEAEGEFRARFEREAKTLSSLRHPGIVTVYDYGEIENFTYMVLEYVEGESLHSILRRRKQLPLDEVVPIVRALGEAVAIAHAAGITHRDIKPGNIMLEDGRPLPRVVLLDFGIAKVKPTENEAEDGPQTRQGFFVGTLQYMAPEQLLGDTVGPPTDQYAIGCLIYRLLVGRTPFIGKPTEIASGHLKEVPPQLPAELNLSVLDPIIARAMAKEIGDRYPSVGDLVNALIECWVSGEADGDARATVPLDIVAFQKAFSSQHTQVFLPQDSELSAPNRVMDTITLSDDFNSQVLTDTREETSHTGMSGALLDTSQPLSGVTLAKRGNPRSLWVSWGLIASLLVAVFVFDWGDAFLGSEDPPPRATRIKQVETDASSTQSEPELSSALSDTSSAGTPEFVDGTWGRLASPKKTAAPANAPTRRRDTSKSGVESSTKANVQSRSTSDKNAGPKTGSAPPRKAPSRTRRSRNPKESRRGQNSRGKRKRGGRRVPRRRAGKTAELAVKDFKRHLRACRCGEADKSLKMIERVSPKVSTYRNQYLEQCGVVGLGCRKRP